jgi:pimeloyl-ACP methyl ester carboxylesterase
MATLESRFGRTLRSLAAVMLFAGAACDGSPDHPARSFAEAKSSKLFVGTDTIAYRDVGSGRPILLLHRFRASMDDWDPLLVDELVAHGRRVIAFDGAGVGESTGAVPASLEGAADGAAELVGAMQLGKVDVLGWSMGGMTAQILAIKYPDVVDHLILGATAPPGGDPEIHGPSAHWGQTATQPSLTRADLLYLFFPASADGVAAGNASLDRTSVNKPAESIKVSAEAMTAQSAALVRFLANDAGWYGRLREIKSPTLVAHGDEDGSFPAVDSTILAREIPGARVVAYPGAGHAFLFQNAPSFAAEVAAWTSK